MKRILIIGAGELCQRVIKQLDTMSHIAVAAVIDLNPNANGLKLAKDFGFETGTEWGVWLNRDIHIILDTTDDQSINKELKKLKQESTVYLSKQVVNVIVEMLEDKSKEQSKSDWNLILDSLPEGMVVVDAHETVTFMNKKAERMIGIEKNKMIEQPIQKTIQQTRLPQVLRTRKQESNQKMTLENGKKTITTTIPIIDGEHKLKGALSVIRELHDVVELADQVSGLKEVKKILDAIFYSSDEAISVVDENGVGIMVNPAYTRLTGLNSKEIIGKPASVDIYEGTSMHLQVLKTRRPVKGVKMKVGPMKKDVLVNVAPIIVDGKIKGSVAILQDVSQIQGLTGDLRRARQIIRNLEGKFTFDDIIGTSNEMKLALEQARVGAKNPSTVLLRGESGAGKELFAYAIHNESDRRHNKFIHVNCVTADEKILERELFGYENEDPSIDYFYETGYFEKANKGSIFLDEIGLLSIEMQAKLLHVLKQDEITRVGGLKPVRIDIRIITATSINLEKAIMNGEFLEELYYRLNRLPIFIPPLRERFIDLEELVQDITLNTNEKYGRIVQTIDKDVYDFLKQYHWPGNVRELENVIARAMIGMNKEEKRMQRKHISPFINDTNQPSFPKQFKNIWNGQTLQQSIDIHEEKVIREALETHGYNKTKTAQALGVSIRNLYYKMDKYNIAKGSVQ
ncbi:sigma 54-interacting transcriptional regulator [Aquibacillus koreensis]|uniref:Sigma 54-interacting transcriptional regulator n=2 Tax=Aquibacillus koreensis TaxID=279446 RepID=A0A9X3WH84_9BACI|nr:sigma 54-interacting transcriptional regulator [Aquibacillus koreensis]MCT2537502.1 sigma 54-interacting transcriptional regulator [Aquibacillus koreensis]MDC3418948.1 sigma 54-interacting transcriptional regulator [Aquibacillus koreensis]